ncbi:MAG TPA: nucleotidyltransferase domain-containing protein [Bacteroides sp.]|nr:nucleotidyltransferase domain-containing protein [Bacteroides sp.]
MSTMDKIDAVKLCKRYLLKVKHLEIGFTEAWLFGSFAHGNQHENSDVDIAIVLNEGVEKSFDLEVQLMLIRRGEETRIEPHAFTKDEFNNFTPIVSQIMKNGERIEI